MKKQPLIEQAASIRRMLMQRGYTPYERGLIYDYAIDIEHEEASRVHA
jgi:hypothetical protein